jgi:hypothetical protein
MTKKLLSFITLVVLFTAVSYAQTWQYAGVFPPANPDTVLGQAHALAVDPDGKVWVSDFSAREVIVGTDTLSVRAIYVYNPDGTEAPFSPVWNVNIGGVIDTFTASTRGMRADGDGNILYVTGGQDMFRIDYTNGQGLGKVELDLGTSPTAPAVDDNGNIFVGPVVPGNPMKIYDSGLNYIGNALDATVGFSRSFEVSGDGNSIYWAGYTNGAVYVYNRPDEFSPYDSVGTILDGFHSESFAYNPKSQCLWASAGSFNDLPDPQFTPGAWYAYDFASETLVDSFTWQFNNPGDPGERPRAIDFSPDGNIAYVGCFGTSGMPLVQKFVRDVTPVTVTFNCNMSVQAAAGNFDPATGSVFVAGSFTDWATSQLQLSDPDGDLTYSVDVPNLEPGTRVFFKFRNGDGWEGDPNREYVVGSAGNTFTGFYDRDLGGGVPVALTFLCDMELEIVSGRFNPATDTLSARGSMNGWGSDDVMFPTVANPNVYEGIITTDVLAGEDINYKFAYELGAGGTTWEDDPNKVYTITQDDINNGFAVIERGFNNLTLSTVTANDATITFTVDMNGAVNALTNVPFGTINSVVIFGGASPLIWPEGGWPSTTTPVIFLNDSGNDGDITAGDGIWSTNVVFPRFTQLNFDYKYGANWDEVATTTGNDNEATTGVNHSISLPQNILSARAVDIWADMSPTTLEDLVVGVEELEGPLPNDYVLEQNYPNPFNPTTTIRFSLREPGMVTLKVYDLLGQEVVTLLNEEKTAGSFEVSFDASQLTSGIYIYTLSANDFSATRKMMLVK